MTLSTISRRNFLGLGAAAMAAAMLPRTAFAKATTNVKPPNFIFIMTDDQGWGDAAFLGHPYLITPNIDRLASEGTTYTQYYTSSPVCSPSRAGIMTGKFPARYAIHGHFSSPEFNEERGMPDQLDPNVVSEYDLLHRAGYTTGHFGKLHLGSDDGTLAGTATVYGADKERINVFSNDAAIFVPDIKSFIDKNRDGPFIANVWMNLPHSELKPTEEELAVYLGLNVEPDKFDGYMQDYVRAAWNMNNQAKTYYAAITELDSAVGMILDYLDDEGLADNTVVVFTSDNGPEDYHIKNTRNAGMGSTGIYRGRKRSVYEGGLRVPLIVRWPGKVKAGVVDDDSVMSGVDIAPTFASIAGVDTSDVVFDGEDISDIWLNGPRKRNKQLYWEYRFPIIGAAVNVSPPVAFRDGDFKLLMNHDGTGMELYNIVQDPSESIDLVDSETVVASEMKQDLLALMAEFPDKYYRYGAFIPEASLNPETN